MSASQLLTIPETADRLRCHRSSVNELINNGHLKAVDVSAKKGARPTYRVRETDLIAFIESRTRTAA